MGNVLDIEEDITAARIKKIAAKTPGGKLRTKFKLRCSRYLYTLSIDDPEKAEKLKQSLPPGAFIRRLHLYSFIQLDQQVSLSRRSRRSRRRSKPLGYRLVFFCLCWTGGGVGGERGLGSAFNSCCMLSLHIRCTALSHTGRLSP